jgi:osmotically-inducible protein OsmY
VFLAYAKRFPQYVPNGLAQTATEGHGEVVTQTLHRTDQELKAAVTEELHYTPNVDAGAMDVVVDDGMVTLSGEVASLPGRLAAKHAAMLVGGVRNVADKLVVRVPVPSPSDQDLADAASQFLQWAVDVPANAVKADVKDHAITLSGQVGWDYQRVAAVRAVTYLKGVTRIHNKISLDQPAPAPDTKATVEAAMRRIALLDAEHITVDIDGPELTLRGTVRSLAERHEAQRAAWSATGVTNVKTELRVVS